jgi:hypothetical protein
LVLARFTGEVEMTARGTVLPQANKFLKEGQAPVVLSRTRVSGGCFYFRQIADTRKFVAGYVRKRQ